MVVRLFSLILLPLVLLNAAAKKTISTARGENEDLILTVTLHIDPEELKQLVSSDLDGHYIIAEVKVDPKYGKDVTIDRGDFLLRSDKEGEKAKPFAGSQIAGQGTLVLSQEGAEVKKSKWSIGGPVMVGGAGNGSEVNKGTTKATMKEDDKENPLKKLLDSKILPEKKTDQPVSGLLYFPMEKQKMKDLQLDFGGRENRISLRFK